MPSVLHAPFRQQTVTITEPTVIVRDGRERPGPETPVGTPLCSVRDITEGVRRGRPGTRIMLALRLYTEDRTTAYKAGQRAALTHNGVAVNLYVEKVITYKRHRQIDLLDHLEGPES